RRRQALRLEVHPHRPQPPPGTHQAARPARTTPAGRMNPGELTAATTSVLFLSYRLAGVSSEALIGCVARRDRVGEGRGEAGCEDAPALERDPRTPFERSARSLLGPVTLRAP